MATIDEPPPDNHDTDNHDTDNHDTDNAAGQAREPQHDRFAGRAEGMPREVPGEIIGQPHDTVLGDTRTDTRTGAGSDAGEVRPVRRVSGVLVPVGRAVRPAQVYAFGRTVVTHERTRRSVKCTGRNLWYPLAGAGVVYARWRDAHGAGRYERMMRQAELTSNHEMLLEWETRDVTEKQRRHDRVMDWVHSPGELIRSAALGVAAVIGLLLALGVILAIAHRDISDVIGPISNVIAAIAFVCWFLSVYGATLLIGATAIGIGGLWHLGRTRAEAPAWIARPADGPERELIPDEGAILAALRNLNLPPLNKKIKEGWQPRWVTPTGRDGKGYRTQLELPAGVTVEMINQRKTVLAHNLVRLPVEVWPTEPKKHPGVLDLWVADQGLLTAAVEPYPLLADGECDYFAGVPMGVDQRGELIHGRLMASNYAIAGTMGSGKTSAVIELLCGAMLDPLVEIEVYVMAYNVDYDPLTPRLSVLVKGDEDDQIVATMTALQNLREEVTARGKILAELGGEETKLTRDIAARDPRMRPRVVVIDECQELFRHDQHGAMSKELAIKLMMKARKVGITLLFVTPAPSADSLPRELAKTVSHRMCFAIGDHQGNDAILGTGAHKRGITAVDLVAGEDIGTAMCSGFGPKPGLLRTHYIRKDKDLDQLTPIVERAMALRADADITTPARPAGGDAAQGRDLLTDVAEVLHGLDRLKATDVAARLRRLAPSWAPYAGLSGEDLAVLLETEGVPVRRLKVTLTVRSGNVVAALADRHESDLDDTPHRAIEDDDRDDEELGETG